MRTRFILALCVCTPWPCLASEGLDEARGFYDELEFQKTLEATERALRTADNQPEDLVEIYRLRGLSFSALGRASEAVQAFERLLAIDPKFRLSRDVSPRLAAAFYQAVALCADLAPITLSHRPSEPNGPLAGLELSVTLESDPQRMVRSVRLVYRATGAAWHRAEPVPVSGPRPVVVRLPKTLSAAEVHYRFEALDEHGGVLARTKAGQRPHRLVAPVPKPARVAARPEPATDAGGGLKAGSSPADPMRQAPFDHGDDRDDEPAAWYQTWWFWTAVGVVVVGAAAGAGVALATGESTGPADYSIRIR